MKVLSTFNGMGCIWIALDRLGIEVDKRYSAEIDKYANLVNDKNYPDTIQLGDVTKVKAENLEQIDLLAGGSPCQGFSFAGKQLNFDDPRSKLFFEFVRLLKECKPKYFLLENVKMKKEYEQVITDTLGVEPIEINSALVSAQNRKRLYWTNLPGIDQPEDKNISLHDILEDGNALKSKSQTIVSTIYKENAKSMHKRNKLGLMSFDHTGKALDYMNRKVKGGRTHWDFGYIQSLDRNKSQCLTANLHKGVPYNVLVDSKPEIGKPKINPIVFRKLTPIECERLQTVPDNYTDCVSDTQRYKMLGNGWTVDVIAHILKSIK